VTEDASLFEFDGEAADDAAPGDEAAADGSATAAEPSPATPTYRWSPDGTPCPVCRTETRRRWRDGDGFVCADCKDW
jgi:hypothetical protein